MNRRVAGSAPRVAFTVFVAGFEADLGAGVTFAVAFAGDADFDVADADADADAEGAIGAAEVVPRSALEVPAMAARSAFGACADGGTADDDVAADADACADALIAAFPECTGAGAGAGETCAPVDPLAAAFGAECAGATSAPCACVAIIRANAPVNPDQTRADRVRLERRGYIDPTKSHFGRPPSNFGRERAEDAGHGLWSLARSSALRRPHEEAEIRERHGRRWRGRARRPWGGPSPTAG